MRQFSVKTVHADTSRASRQELWLRSQNRTMSQKKCNQQDRVWTRLTNCCDAKTDVYTKAGAIYDVNTGRWLWEPSAKVFCTVRLQHGVVFTVAIL